MFIGCLTTLPSPLHTHFLHMPLTSQLRIYSLELRKNLSLIFCLLSQTQGVIVYVCFAFGKLTRVFAPPDLSTVLWCKLCCVLSHVKSPVGLPEPKSAVFLVLRLSWGWLFIPPTLPLKSSSSLSIKHFLDILLQWPRNQTNTLLDYAALGMMGIISFWVFLSWRLYFPLGYSCWQALFNQDSLDPIFFSL